MTEFENDELVRRAEELYAAKLRAVLEPEHLDEFIAIEPDSGDYFLGRTMREVSAAARRAHPQRLTYMMRVGGKAAVHNVNHNSLRPQPVRTPVVKVCWWTADPLSHRIILSPRLRGRPALRSTTPVAMRRPADSPCALRCKSLR